MDERYDPGKICRVILLLDMDCFYAQCETVRLGLDQDIPLALIQWNSALAVNYRARDFGIKRGDSFQIIQQKSGGECVAIHLPVVPVSEAESPTTSSSDKKVDFNGNNEDNGGDHGDDSPRTMGEHPDADLNGCADDSFIPSSREAYNAEFNKPRHVREKMYRLEKNTMRHPHEGKACLNRYRLASSQIFSLIDETLAKNVGKENYILERASIDELFVDVTKFCSQSPEEVKANSEHSDDCHGDDEVIQSVNNLSHDNTHLHSNRELTETVICHGRHLQPFEKENDLGKALCIGCNIALLVRQAVFQKLGFTLSAGISTSKLVSKLAASYGKPNGQAVIFPGSIPQVMEETQIRKARMLGGKLGKKVLTLLPEAETTMGSIARLLTLSDLTKGIGVESGRWLFDACRGICNEQVKPTLNVLPKSITAFKSFTKVSYPDLEKWTTLLAGDVLKRVELDTIRNNRVPKHVTVTYATKPGGEWVVRSFRLLFPTEKDLRLRIQKLVNNTKKILKQRGHFPIHRIGYSASDFITRPKSGIDSFFSSGISNNAPSPSRKRSRVSEVRDRKRNYHAETGSLHNFFPSQNSLSKSSKHPQKKNPLCLDAHNGKESLKSIQQTVGTSPGSNSSHNVQSKKASNDDTTAQGHETIHKPICVKPLASVPEVHQANDEAFARQLQSMYDEEAGTQAHFDKNSPKKTEGASRSSLNDFDRDEAIAQQLQSKYDKEHALSAGIESFPNSRKAKSSKYSKARPACVKNRIDFFLHKK